VVMTALTIEYCACLVLKKTALSGSELNLTVWHLIAVVLLDKSQSSRLRWTLPLTGSLRHPLLHKQ
jgi:hypothetical protein